jgi:signal transduction histidine kinase
LLKDRNDELAIANIELQKLDQLKTDFVSLVSHELRGPLTTLNGGIELVLKDKDSIPNEAKRIFEIMADESKRLTNFVQTILDVSKLDAGKLNLNLGLVTVAPLLRRVTEVTLLGSERKVIMNEPESVPAVWADEIYLEKILCNLVSNADKYSPKGEPIEINIEKGENSLDISVIDYGTGIPSENHKFVFDRFMRLQTGEKLSAKGWGLGLYFSKALAEAQGGSISLKSPITINGNLPGTSFTVTLPLEREENNSE